MRPVAVIQEHFCLHVVDIVVDINLVRNLLVVGIRRETVATQPINHSLVICRRTCARLICTAGRRFEKVDIVRVVTVLGFVIVFVVAFTQVMDAVILAIVIYDNITATLVIHTKTFCHRGSQAIAQIVVTAIVTEVSQRERLELFEFRVIREQRVF